MDIVRLFLSLGISGWLILLVVFLLSRWYLTRARWDKEPPGPASLPFIGSILSIPDKDFRKGFMKISDKYGPVTKLDIGSKTVVVLNGFDIIHEALVKIGPVLAGRPPMPEVYYRKDLGVSILNGDTWTDQRRFILHTLRNFGLGKDNLETLMHEELMCLRKELSKHSEPMDPYDLLQYTASNVIGSFAFGKRMDYDDARLKDCVDSVSRACTLLDNNGFLHFFPMLRYLPGDIFKAKELKNVMCHLRDIGKSWVEEVQSKYDYTSEPNDLIESYLVEMKKNEGNDKTSFHEEMLYWHIVDMYGGGVDTTAATITAGIIYMLLNPDVQEKVHAEIDDVIGRDRLPSYSDKAVLPYCEAVITEIHRRWTVLPLAIAHAPLEDATLTGYHIPKDTTIILNMYSISRDPRVWTDPEKFDPNRFLNSEGKFKKHPQFSPFGLGKRNCIGESLAVRELFIMFVGLMQQFRFELPEGAPKPDPDGTQGLIVHPKPFTTLIVKRD